MLLPFPGERTSAARSTSSAGSGATRSPSPTRVTWPRTPSAPSASRSSTTPGATASSSDPAATSPGRRSSSATRTAGSTVIAACGVSTPATGSPASAPRPDRSTPGPAPSASRGTTRSASPGLDKVAPPSQADRGPRDADRGADAARAGVVRRGRRAGRLAARSCDAELGGRPGDRRAGWLPGRPRPTELRSRRGAAGEHSAPGRSSSARPSPPARPAGARPAGRASTTRALHLHHASEPEPPAVDPPAGVRRGLGRGQRRAPRSWRSRSSSGSGSCRRRWRSSSCSARTSRSSRSSTATCMELVLKITVVLAMLSALDPRRRVPARAVPRRPACARDPPGLRQPRGGPSASRCADRPGVAGRRRCAVMRPDPSTVDAVPLRRQPAPR